MLTVKSGMRWIRFDTAAVIAVRKGPDPSSDFVRMIGDQKAR